MLSIFTYVCLQMTLISAYGNLLHMTGNMTFNHKSIHPKSHKNFEHAIRTYDKEIFHSAIEAADKSKIEVRGFYHVSTTVGHWIEVLEEHLMMMDGKRFASSLFITKLAESTKLSNLGMKLSTGWSSVLEIVDFVEINFDAASSFSNVSSAEQTAAYTSLTTMISNLHLRNGLEKVVVKPYADVHADEASPVHKSSSSSSSRTKSRARKVAPATLAERLELGSVLGEINSINDLHAYCTARHEKKKISYVFLMHNQETNCTEQLMKHVSAQVCPLHLFCDFCDYFFHTY
jgi:hypothetical protein